MAQFTRKQTRYLIERSLPKELYNFNHFTQREGQSLTLMIVYKPALKGQNIRVALDNTLMPESTTVSTQVQDGKVEYIGTHIEFINANVFYRKNPKFTMKPKPGAKKQPLYLRQPKGTIEEYLYRLINQQLSVLDEKYRHARKNNQSQPHIQQQALTKLVKQLKREYPTLGDKLYEGYEVSKSNRVTDPVIIQGQIKSELLNYNEAVLKELFEPDHVYQYTFNQQGDRVRIQYYID